MPALHRDGVVATVEARGIEDLRELDRLRDAVVDLRSSRRRLVLADDADRQEIEGELHQSVQQDLVALSTMLQIAAGSASVDQRVVLDEALRTVEAALDHTRLLAQRIYPPLLEAGGLAVALRTAAVSAGIRARIVIDADAPFAREVARTVYLCCVVAFERAEAGSEATVTARVGETTLAFEVVAGCRLADGDIVRLRDRVEALGGQLAIGPDPDHGTRAVGTIPLSA